ncbi:MAG: hypothetical protein IT577_18575 [Verrucomicrobiae bacterium]|nr:hypothetical protein [Verrucomicrobiae bacterium]
MRFVRLPSCLAAAAMMICGAPPSWSQADRTVWEPGGAPLAPPVPWLLAPGDPGSVVLPNLVQFGVIPPADPPALAITVLFSEARGAGLRATWTTANGVSTILANDLFEGIGIDNRRTLLIPASLLDAPGALTFEDPRGDVHLLGAIFEWTPTRRLWVAPGAEDAAFVTSEREVIDIQRITGGPAAAPPDRWSGRVFRGALYDEPVQLPPQTAFEFELEKSPARFRLETLVAGLPPDAVVRVYLNGSYAGPLQVDIPSLTDPGYRGPQFIGWRKATALPAAHLLAPGINRIWFDWDTPSPQKPPFLGIKEPILEIEYAPNPSP